MITKIYICDLCDEEATVAEAELWGRLKFDSDGDFDVCCIMDREASETVICQQCLASLQRHLTYKRTIPD